MQRRGVASKVPSTFGLWCPICKTSACWNALEFPCAPHDVITDVFMELCWSSCNILTSQLESNSNILLTHGHACVTFFFGDQLSDSVLEQAHVVLSSINSNIRT